MSFVLTIGSVPCPFTDLPRELYGRPKSYFGTVDEYPNDGLRTLGYAIAQIEFFEGEYHGSPQLIERNDRAAGELIEQLQKEAIPFVEDSQTIPPIFGPVGWLNLLIQAGPAVTGALAGVLGAWLQQRGNRRLRMKMGDREFEARTVEDLKVLMELASTLQTEAPLEDRNPRIEALAHRLWVLRGRPEGEPEVDWLRAKEIIEKFGR